MGKALRARAIAPDGAKVVNSTSVISPSAVAKPPIPSIEQPRAYR